MYYRRHIAKGMSDEDLKRLHEKLDKFTGLDKVIPKLIFRNQIEVEAKRRGLIL